MTISNNNGHADTYVDTIPQHDLNAEKWVLGAMLQDAGVVALAIEHLAKKELQPVLYDSRHQAVFEACVDLFDNSIQVDLLAVADRLKLNSRLDQVGGHYYLTELISVCISTVNAEFHIATVLDKAILRALQRSGIAIATMAAEATIESADVLSLAEKQILNITIGSRGGNAKKLDQLLHGTFEEIEGYHKNPNGGITGVATGFCDLDRMTHGLQRGDLIIIAGRPSMGKTTFALDIARYAGAVLKIGVAFFSLEMINAQLSMRVLGAEAKIDMHRAKSGRLDKEEFLRLGNAASRLAAAPIWVDDTPKLGILDVRSRARRFKAQFDIGVIVVDYLQLMSKPRAERMDIAIGLITQDLKALAKELDVPVVILSQLSREVEKRSNQRPQLSDLRESGAIEQDADVVLFPWRPGMNDPTIQISETELIIAKQRNGPTGSVSLLFHNQFCTFANIERAHEEHWTDKEGIQVGTPF